MKIYLAGMGANDEQLLKEANKSGKTFNRLISFAYKSDADKIIKLKKGKSNEKKRIVKRIIIRKTRNSK